MNAPAFGEGSPRDWMLPGERKRLEPAIPAFGRKPVKTPTAIQIAAESGEIWAASDPCFYCERFTLRLRAGRRRHRNLRERTVEHLIPGWSPVRLQTEGLKVIACYECNERQGRLQSLAPRSATPFSPPLMQGHPGYPSPKHRRKFFRQAAQGWPTKE